MSRCLITLSVLVVLSCGCSRGNAASSAPARTTASSPPPAPAEDTSYRHTAADRVVAIGDLHGDVDAARRALQLAGAIGPEGNWVGGRLVVVQVGDEIDRGDTDREVIDLFEQVRREAAGAGGAVYPLNGNHETMNVAGDFTYTTKGGFADFEGTRDAAADNDRVKQFPPEQRARAAAFAPGGPYALKLATRDVVIVVNDTVFVHGALMPEHVRYGLARINAETRAWMRGEIPVEPEMVASHGGPTWRGAYSDEILAPETCQTLGEVLEKVRARRMVVGHTVQKGGIHSGCDGRIWSIDVGLARVYVPGSNEILEISGDQVRVLGGPKTDEGPR